MSYVKMELETRLEKLEELKGINSKMYEKELKRLETDTSCQVYCYPNGEHSIVSNSEGSGP